MIAASQFVEAARKHGFEWYAGVPCSFLTPFINYVIDDPSLSYVSAANEGDAVAMAAGATIGGRRTVVMMQNSGLGNAVNPLTSLAHTFNIPMLVIITLRGDPELKDEPQHELMGRITGPLLSAMTIPWEFFPTDAEPIPEVLHRATDYMERKQRPYALLVRKGTVEKHSLQKSGLGTPEHSETNFQHINSNGQSRPTRTEALKVILEHTPEANHTVVATTGYTGRELYALADRPNQLYMVGSMGCASAIGMGIAMAQPRQRVVAIDGDGAALMRMGNFATIGAYGCKNIVHIVLDNEVHDSTGAQATVSTGISFASIAQACGYAHVLEGESLRTLDALFQLPGDSGPVFAHLKIQPGAPDKLPRPGQTPAEVCRRLMTHLTTHSAL